MDNPWRSSYRTADAFLRALGVALLFAGIVCWAFVRKQEESGEALRF